MYIQLLANEKSVFMYDPDFSTLIETHPNDTYEPGVTKDIISEINSADCFLDIGSLYGYYSLYLSMFTQTIPLYAIEPNPYFNEIIRYNIESNKISNITIIPYGLSDRTEELLIDDKCIDKNKLKTPSVFIKPQIPVRTKKNTLKHSAPSSYMHLIFLLLKKIVFKKKTNTLFKIGLIKLDSWLEDKKYNNIVAKMDIHGFEAQALKGMLNSLNKGLFRCLYIEIHAEDMLVEGNFKELHAILQNDNYNVFEITNYRRSFYTVNLLSKHELLTFFDSKTWSFMNTIEMRMLKLARKQ